MPHVEPAAGSSTPVSDAPPAIRARELTKQYIRYDGPRYLFRDLRALLAGSRSSASFTALDRVSIDVPRGQTLGVIGVNGAGKSTILRLIAGISSPTSGSIEVDGRVASLLEFGAGFESRLPARENVVLNGMLLGIPRAVIRAKVDEILAWAELEDHANAPLFTFSSGMSMRLGFAIAVQAPADVLLFDEILAVGDLNFQAKCFRVIEQFKREGKTIVFVSHDMYEIGNLCDSVLLLNHGRKEAVGPPSSVIQRYWSTLVTEESRGTLAAGPLRVDFVSGKLYVWWGAVALTKGFCGYTSVRHFVRWHESDKGAWKVVERTSEALVVEGASWGLPLRQRWEMRIAEGRLSLRVELRSTEATRLERVQTNLMLSERFDTFFGPAGTSGSLGAFRRAVDDDWDVVFAAPSADGAIGVSSAASPELPSVVLRSEPVVEGQEVAVVNSDMNFCGRLLQARVTTGTLLPPDTPVTVFRGVFEFKS